MIVGSVTPEVYKRVEEHAAKASPAPVSSNEAGGTKPTSEQIKNIVGAAPPTAPSSTNAAPSTMSTDSASSRAAPSATKPESVGSPDAWEALRVGDHVVAKYWEADGTPFGWWIGIIVEIKSDGVFIIRWPDEQKTPPLKIERKHIAILHRSYDVNTEWHRRR
jgi:hypothetical protein